MSSGNGDRENGQQPGLEDERDERHVLAAGEIVIGTLAGLNEHGRPLVNFCIFGDLMNSVEATTTVGITQREVGRQAAILFVESDIRKPVVIGLVHSPLDMLLESYGSTEISLEKAEQDEPPPEHADTAPMPELEDITVDGKRIQIEGREEIVFKCGESSITLTRAGKITIRGKYILNRSSGVNRILGGSVQVN